MSFDRLCRVFLVIFCCGVIGAAIDEWLDLHYVGLIACGLLGIAEQLLVCWIERNKANP